MKEIYLAGGCFWGLQKFFDQFDGVMDTEVGYANGPKGRPCYEEVCNNSGHAETVRIQYDESVMSLADLLNYYFLLIDPISVNRQGNDTGIQYRTGVYYNDLLDGVTAETYFSSVLEPNYKIEIKKLCNYFPAEEYHQDYLTKNPHGYCHVNLGLIKPNEKKDA